MCNHSPHVTVCRVGNGDFYDYKACFSKFYTTIKPIKSQHIFSCIERNGNSNATDVMMATRVSNLEEHLPTNINLLRKTFYDKSVYKDLVAAFAARKDLLYDYPLESIPFPGLPAFKQVQLYKNYRKFLPAAYKDVTCPRPTDEVMKSEKDDQTKRRHAKMKKKRDVTSKTDAIDNAGGTEATIGSSSMQLE